MDLNFKNIPKSIWITLVIVLGIMGGALIFKPEFTDSQNNIITGVVIVVLVYVLGLTTGIWRKLFGKKDK